MQQPEVQASLVAYGEELAEARRSFGGFVERIDVRRQTTILCDGDVDGLGAGVVLWHYLMRRGIDAENISAFQPEKGENAFTPSTRGYVARSHPRALFVLDLGVSERQIVHEVPT